MTSDFAFRLLSMALVTTVAAASCASCTAHPSEIRASGTAAPATTATATFPPATTPPELTPGTTETLEQSLAMEDGNLAEAPEFAAIIDRLLRCFRTGTTDGPVLTREDEAFAFWYPWKNAGRQGNLLDYARRLADTAQAGGYCQASPAP